MMDSATQDHPRRVVITGVGALSPLGDAPDAIHSALCAGQSGVVETTFEGSTGLDPLPAGRIDFDPKQYLEGNLRPIDRTGRLVIAAAGLALEDSGWDAERRAERPVGLVLGTMYCSVHTIVAFDQRALDAGPKYVRPFDFANSVINAAAGQTAIWHGLRGVNSTLAGGTAAGLEALAYAADLIRSGRSQAIVAGGGDELCFESCLAFQRGGALSPGDARPFDTRRDGFNPAEGAALFVLEEADAAERRGARILAEIHGHASAYDVSRGTDGASTLATVERTVRLALGDAGLAPTDIDAISAGANGARSDAHEAAGLDGAFRDRPTPVPVTAVKSMLGESLGASGAFQTLAMLESLRSQRLPGIRGFERSDEPWDALSLDSQCRELPMHYGLIHAPGLDGNHCALVLGRGGRA